MSNSDYLNRLELICDASAPRWARAHTRDLLGHWGVPEDVAHDALTIVSELVTNAFRYAGGEAGALDPTGRPRARVCALLLAVTDHHLLVSVDDGDRRAPVRRVAAAGAESGRGLETVAALCGGHWGVTYPPDGPGKSVWARLPLPGRPAWPGSRSDVSRGAADTRRHVHQRA